MRRSATRSGGGGPARALVPATCYTAVVSGAAHARMQTTKNRDAQVARAFSAGLCERLVAVWRHAAGGGKLTVHKQFVLLRCKANENPRDHNTVGWRD
jgi:hypothetical protein